MKNYKPEEDSSNLLKLTDANFKKNILKGVVLVDFWAPWCAPCRMIGPVVSELAEDFAGKAKIGKLNVDENKQIASEFGIRSIPTLILFKDGKPVEKFTGIKPKQAFAKAINAQLNS
ncbi:MAG: thioredoxin [Bacteroidales bacterium]|nr:thioredoxin [Bacteroidales bacterium]